ncbi:MAG: hypothetical protein PHW82_13950, partial [Bacteroidales bacterium]|nr:hypothetical protein [Bacteroidales bacterium]
MVEAKCMNGHVFEVTKDMVGVTKSGTSFKATCPECRAPAQLTHAKVIEIMGLADNKEARALKEKMARELKESGEAKPSAKSPSTPKKAALRPSHVEIEDEPEDEGEDEVIAPYAPSAPTLPVEPVDTHSLSEMLGEALNNRPRPSAPAQSIRRPHPPIDVMGTAANIRDRNDILRDTIGATNLPDPIKSKVTRFIDLKPEGLAPHELYSVLTYLGVGNAPALAVVRAYEFDLSLQQKELEQEKQVFSLLGVPLPGTNQPNQSQYPGPGVLPSGNPAPPQSNASSNPFLTPLPRPSGGSNTPPVENKPPQIDPTALLPLAMQNPQAFQMLASNPQRMQAVAQNPALMVQFVQMAGNASNQQKPKDEGMSRDEVRAIVSAELGELKKILVESKADRKDDALVEELKQNRAFMFEMMKSQTAAASAPRNDPMAEHQSKITEVLLQNLLDSQNRDNTGIILGALEELKKNQTGIGSGSQSIEGMNLFLRYQELMNQMDETKQKYQDEREKRESLKEIVNTAA